MALDLSPERFGSKATPDEVYKSIQEEAARITQRKEDAKAIAKEVAKEVIKELDKREADKETAETIPETIPVETVAVVEVPEPEPIDYTLPIASAACGFLIGVLITSLCFIIKLNRIRRETERW
jgi:hypothetical protein